jgi:hypothetical protein
MLGLLGGMELKRFVTPGSLGPPKTLGSVGIVLYRFINYQHHQLCCGVFVDLAESSFEPCEDRPHTGEWDTEPNMDMGQNLHSFQTTG